MATAENLDREKHHFHPAENHNDSFNYIQTIHRDYLGFEFVPPPCFAPSYALLESDTPLGQVS